MLDGRERKVGSLAIFVAILRAQTLPPIAGLVLIADPRVGCRKCPVCRLLHAAKDNRGNRSQHD
jgi:hypothetical protein